MTGRKVFVSAQSVVSPLGIGISENFMAVVNGRSTCIRTNTDNQYSNDDLTASFFQDQELIEQHTFFESLCIKTLHKLFTHVDKTNEPILLVLSTTKGNIALIEENDQHSRLQLTKTAKIISSHFSFSKTIVVSTACTSGVASLITATRYLKAGKFSHAVVLGAEVMSKFVVAGFQSLMAMSSSPCKPFDKKRNGINLGEAAAAIYLTTDSSFSDERKIVVAGTGMSNDANHISGPSRSGEELAEAIQMAMNESEIQASDIDFISAHGTATLFNDEMESKAFNLKQLGTTPIHSLKGYFGHTLGAAGVLESAICVEALHSNKLIASAGFEEIGVSLHLNVVQNTISKPMSVCLKTASGFGGTNAAIIFRKE